MVRFNTDIIRMVGGEGEGVEDMLSNQADIEWVLVKGDQCASTSKWSDTI